MYLIGEHVKFTVDDDSSLGIIPQDVQSILLQHVRVASPSCLVTFDNNRVLILGVDIERQNVPSVQRLAIRCTKIEWHYLTFCKTKRLWLVHIMIKARVDSMCI